MGVVLERHEDERAADHRVAAVGPEQDHAVLRVDLLERELADLPVRPEVDGAMAHGSVARRPPGMELGLVGPVHLADVEVAHERRA
jgi:hypothetical protein